MTAIPVVFCFDSRIILGASVAIKSLIDCAKDSTTYDIRIFHSDIKLEDQKNLSLLTKNTRHSIAFHYIDPHIFNGAPRNKGSWTEIVYYRLLTPEILKEYDKAIYSDVDVLFKGDLSEVYNMNLDGYEIGAVPSCTVKSIKVNQPERHFPENKNEKNYMSGFIIFNCKLMREEKTVNKFFETIKIFNKRLVFFDLDTLNLTCAKIKDVPLTYCVFETMHEYTNIKQIGEYKVLSSLYSDKELYSAAQKPIIIHYAGKMGKPWQRKWVPNYYQEYIDKLPKVLKKYTFRDIRKKIFSSKKLPKQHFDVLITNFWHSNNYGACLTAYALQECVKKLGYNCAFIDEFDIRKKYKLGFSRLFSNRHLKLAPKTDDFNKLGKMADIFISGSDQVFRPNYLKKGKYKEIFLLDFADKNAKKIAFSASFGISEDEFKKSKKNIVQYMKKTLEEFDFVSCREESGVSICKNELNMYAEYVLDPVFLVDKDIFLNLAKNSCKNFENKIVSYVLDKNPDLDSIYRKLEEKYGLEVVDIFSGNYTVEDWIKAYYDAKYVITDSYHGTCFALLFNKPFISLVNKKRGIARFNSLVKLFNIDTNFVSDYSDTFEFMECDWNKVNSIIENERQKGIGILKKELGTKRKGFITKNCTGCSACCNICPNNAIKMEENSEGFLYPVVNSKLCTECGLCKKTCPVNTPKKNNNLKKPECFAIMANDKIRMSGVSSGGASSVMMEKVVQDGGYVAGVVYDDEMRAFHLVSNDSKDIERFKGSKYFQSDVSSVYKSIETLLKDGKFVLFSGTPCQVAGLKNYLKTDYQNLITLDLVCHGAPAYKLLKMHLDKLLQDENEKVLSINFRDKKFGWNSKLNMVINTNAAIYESPAEKNPFMAAFLRNLSLRKSCFKCPFQKIPRQGDITIGDFWRIARYKKELDDNKGTSLVLLNNNKGRKFFEDIKKDFLICEQVPLKCAIKGNKTLIAPVKSNPKRDYFMLNVNKDNFAILLKELLGDKFNG